MEEMVKTKKVYTEILERQYVFFVNAFSILAIVALTTFSLVNVMNHDLFLGLIEFTLAIILIVNLILLWITRDSKLCTFVLLGGVYVVLLILLVSGGIANTGIFWFFTFPPAVFFLMGRKGAVIWLLLLYAGVITLTILALMNQIHLAYSFLQIRQFLIAHLVVSIMLYIYESTRKTFEDELENNRKSPEKK